MGPKNIPIVFGYGIDPVKQGLVASLNRPGGNITGIISLASELFGKQLGILHELLPQAAHFGVLANPKGAQHKIHALRIRKLPLQKSARQSKC